MYKYLDKKRSIQIKKIEKEFCKLSKIITKEKFEYYWWFHEISRLDFRPWGGLNTENFFNNDIKLKRFLYRFFSDLIQVICFIFKGIFYKKEKFFYKNIFISEKVLFTKKNKNFYFNGIYNKTKSKHKIIASLTKVNDKTSKDLNSLIGINEKFMILFQSLLIQLKLFFFLKKMVKQRKINKFWIEYFFIKQNLKNIYINLIIYNFVSKNEFCKNIIFPYEEKTLERSIISGLSLKKNNKNVKTYGICVNPQHNLSSFLKKFEELNIPRTNRYLFCGSLYRKYFKKLKRLNILSNEKNDCLGSHKSKIFKTKLIKNSTILVLLSHINEFHTLIKYIKERKKLQNYQFIIRPYPHSTDEKEILNNLKKNKLNNLKISKNTLKNDIKKCYCVIFSGTSAGIEAINCGRIGIWSNLSNVGINPLFDNLNNFLPNCSAPQLEKKIKLVIAMKNQEFKKVLIKQQKYCQNIYSKLDINIINNNLNTDNEKTN
jgi:hypothetical protein